MALKKYKIVNVPEGTKYLKSGKYGDLKIDRMTDDQAEKLFNDGSHYVEAVVTEKKNKPE